jgi:hypothetical protein
MFREAEHAQRKALGWRGGAAEPQNSKVHSSQRRRGQDVDDGFQGEACVIIGPLQEHPVPAWAGWPAGGWPRPVFCAAGYA